MGKAQDYVLWGSAGHAKVLASMISLSGGRVVAIFDNNPQAVSSLPGIPLFIGLDGFVQWVRDKNDHGNLHGLAAIGGFRGDDRMKVQQIFRDHSLLVEPIVHPSASVCATSKMGSGTQILAQSIVAADAQIGEACIINHKASVDHECVLADGVHLAPGSTLCGCVTLDKNVMIGAGAVVLPRISVGANAIVGGGAVVTKNVPPNAIVYGNPAQIHRYRNINK